MRAVRLSEYVRQYLEETGRSQRDLAKSSGISPQTITNVLKDRGGADTETYCKIAKGMGRPIYRLAVVNGIAYINVPEDDEEEKFAEYLEDLRTRPEMKMLFKTSKGMTKEQIQAVVQMLENLKGN